MPIGSLINDSNVHQLVRQFFTNPEQLPAGIPRNMSDWDVSAVTIMSNLFYNIWKNIPSLNNWNVSNVVNMDYMFSKSNYNQPLNRWKVGNVTSMQCMFAENFEFNQPINRWNVKKVTDMSGMFAGYGYERTKFNQNIDSWDVGNVTTMRMMFYSSSFNKPLSSWNVENVEDMNSMFCWSKFNHSLNEWNVANVYDFEDMFRDSAMRTEIEWQDKINSNANITDMFANSIVPEWYENMINQSDSSNQSSNYTSSNESESEDSPSNDLNTGRLLDVSHISLNSLPNEPSLVADLQTTLSEEQDEDDWADDDEPEYEESDEEDLNAAIQHAVAQRRTSSTSTSTGRRDVLETNIAQIAPVPIPSIQFTIPPDATAYDILEMADVNVSEYMQADPDNIVFISGKVTNPVYYLSTRSQIARQRNEPTFIRFACRAVDKTAIMPRAENVDKTVAYLSLRSLHLGDGLVAMGEINYLLQNPEYRAVRVSPESVRVLPATASQNMLESTNDQYRAVSAMHCQEGSNAKVYSLSAIQPVYPTVYVLVYTEPFNYVVGLFSTEEKAISCKNIVSTNFTKERFPTTHGNFKKYQEHVQQAFFIIPTTHVNPDRPIYVIMDEGDRLLYDINDPTSYLTNNMIVWKEGQDNIGAESSANFAMKCIRQIDPGCRVRP